MPQYPRTHQQAYPQRGAGGSRVAFEFPETESNLTLTSERAARREGHGRLSSEVGAIGGGSGEFVDSDIESEASLNSALSTQSERPGGRRDGGQR